MPGRRWDRRVFRKARRASDGRVAFGLVFSLTRTDVGSSGETVKQFWFLGRRGCGRCDREIEHRGEFVDGLDKRGVDSGHGFGEPVGGFPIVEQRRVRVGPDRTGGSIDSFPGLGELLLQTLDDHFAGLPNMRWGRLMAGCARSSCLARAGLEALRSVRAGILAGEDAGRADCETASQILQRRRFSILSGTWS